jgi:hypothetical protein
MMKPDEKKHRPGLQRGFESLTQEDDTAKVVQVIKRLTGRDVTQSTPSEIPHSSSFPVQKPSSSQRSKANATAVNITSPIIDPIEANYYKVPNAVSDVLASLQSPTEQVVYHRLFRLAYGYHQNVCRVGMHALAKATNIASKKTIAKAITGLCEKGHIAIIQEAHNDVRGTWYRVFLPEEVETTQENTRSKNTAVNSTLVKSSAVIFVEEKEKNTVVENTVVLPDLENPGLEPSSVKSTAVNFTPNKTIGLKKHSLSAIVDQFYQFLNQNPSKRKRERAITEGEKLIQEGFTLDDLAYTTSWVIKKYPDTGSFERISYFIDQALKEKVVEKKSQEAKQHLQTEIKQRQAEEQRVEQERKKIEEIKASLPTNVLDEVRQEAIKLLQEEKANLGLGREILIRLKMNDLLMTRYSSQASTA